MKEILSIFRVIGILSSLVFLIFGIRTKSRNKLKTLGICSVGNMAYLLADLFIFPAIFDLYVGLEVIVYGVATIIAGALTVAALIVIILRRKRVTPIENDSKPMWPLLYIIAAVCIVSCFALECTVLNDANLVFVHEPNGFSSDYYNVAVTNHAATQLDVGEKYFKDGGQECEYYEYDIIQTGVHEYQIQSPYHDPELKEIDREVIERIYMFDDFKKNKSVLNYYSDEYCIKGLVKKIVGTDYYICSWLISNNSEIGGGGTVYGEAIFLNDQFIDNIEIGNIDKILFYNSRE